VVARASSNTTNEIATTACEIPGGRGRSGCDWDSASALAEALGADKIGSPVIRRIFGIYSVFALSLMLWATPGIANTQATQATDPSAASPAGVVYSIPLDTARQDAAPHHPTSAGAGGAGGSTGGTGGSTGSTGATGGGTGATGGGTGATGGGTGGSTGAGSSGGSGASATISSASSGSRSERTPLAGSATRPPVLVAGGQPGSLIHSANGFGSSSSVPGLNEPTSAGLAAVQGNAGSAPLLASLLSLILLAVGGFIGARAWRAPRRNRAADVG
jgi:hypothetical protein